jgi:hypothetical protein
MANSKTGTKAAKTTTTITKMDAVRQALSALGKKVLLLQVRDYVKQHFGVEMTGDQVSVCKGKILHQRLRAAKATAKAATKSAAPKRAVAKPSTQTSVAKNTTPTRPAPQGNGISLDDIETVKALVERVGAGSLRKLIDLMAG